MWLRLIIILALVTLAEYYSYVVVRSSLRTFSPAWRTGLIVLYIVMTCITWFGVFTFRYINWSILPLFVRNLYVAFTMGFVVGKLVVLLFMVLDDIRRFGTWLMQSFYSGGPVANIPADRKGIPRSIFLSRLALIAGAFMLSAFMYGTRNRYNYQVRRTRLKADGLPDAFRGIKIVQLSDIHAGSFDNPEAVARGVRLAMDQKPDLIVFTGDLVNHRADEVTSYKEILSALHAPLGVYSILGNHDYGDYVHWDSDEAKAENMERMKQVQQEMGWKLLLNEHAILERDGQSIALIGVENWGSRAGFPKYGKLEQALTGLPEKNIPFQILLSHDPSHWDAEVLEHRPEIQLTLSGHTHGMQFGVDIPGLKWSPVQYVYKNWGGLYSENNQHLYVNRGFGFIGYPGRLGILPEITVLELT